MGKLSPFYSVNQNTSWAPNDAAAYDRPYTCGPSSVVACMSSQSGVATSVAYLNQMIHTPGWQMTTTFAEMQYLLSRCETNSFLQWPGDRARYEEVIKYNVDRGYPLIPLRYFGYPGDPYWHFVCVYGYGDGGQYIMDVWDGSYKHESWDRAWQMYTRNGVLEVKRKRMLGDK
jgi:hypothetical protein